MDTADSSFTGLAPHDVPAPGDSPRCCISVQRNRRQTGLGQKTPKQKGKNVGGPQGGLSHGFQEPCLGQMPFCLFGSARLLLLPKPQPLGCWAQFCSTQVLERQEPGRPSKEETQLLTQASAGGVPRQVGLTAVPPAGETGLRWSCYLGSKGCSQPPLSLP